jgi:excisionase family DNA binding protein
MESMMTARQVAELLGVHENWVYDQAASGELPSYKIGGTRRFDPDELRGWIADHRESENGRQPRRRSARKAIAEAAARRRVQPEGRQSDIEQPARLSRRRDGKAERVADDEQQPQLFEI